MDERITLDRTPPDQMDKAQWRRSANPSVRVERPFDPAPLMAELRRRVKSSRYRFAVFGDTHHSPAFQKITRLVRAMRADFVLAAGDLVKLGGGREGPGHYARLEAEAAGFLRALPVWPVIGNHDTDSRWENDVWNGFANFKAFYNLPPYYSFAFRNATFVCLSWMLPDEDEMAWLERPLAERTTEHVFVVQHYPLYRPAGIVGANTSGASTGAGAQTESSGAPTSAQPRVESQGAAEARLRALLAARRVTAHFSGHAHIYYRTERDGVTYIVSGGAGANLSALSDLAATQPGDSYIGRLNDGGDYVQRVGGRETIRRDPIFFFVLIDVDGSAVSGKLISAEGDILEEFRVPGRQA